MDVHQWEDFSNPRNRRVLIKGCVKCGALRGSAQANLGTCVETSLENNPLAKMGWVLADGEKIDAQALARVLRADFTGKQARAEAQAALASATA